MPCSLMANWYMETCKMLYRISSKSTEPAVATVGSVDFMYYQCYNIYNLIEKIYKLDDSK